MQFSKYQDNIFNWVETGKGNSIVQARAGSGKTFSALHSMVRMQGKVCSLTFNKKNSVELAEKIASMGLVNCKGSTFHAEGFANYRRSQKFVKVDNSKVYFIAEKYTQDQELAPARSFIKNIVSLAKQSGFGVDECPSITNREAWMDLVKHYDITLDAEIGYSDAIEIAIQVLQESNRDFKNIDFDDMIYLPLLKNLDLIKYDWIIVDEAQDTNVCRKIMAKRMGHENTRYLFIGDDAQAIYGFTGAENDSMQLIKEQFNCKEFALPICYRCGSNIIAEAQKIVPDIQAKEDAVEGIVRSEKYVDFLEYSSNYNLTKKDGIICRNNAPLVSLAFGLIRRGIGCRIEGRDIGKNLITLCNKWKKVKDLNQFLAKLIVFFEAEFAKPMNKNKMQLLEDKMETMILLIERCQAIGEHSLEGLKKLIESMFSDSDEKGVPNVVVLSSIHKAKGLEFQRCFILGRNQFMPSKYATQDWQLVQEKNLEYVAITRAMEELVFVTDVPTKRKAVEEE